MPRKHLIASGVSEGHFDICIWVKPVRKFLLFCKKTSTSWKDGSRSRGTDRFKLNLSMAINILMVVIALWATCDSWGKLIDAVRSYFKLGKLLFTQQLYQTALSTTSGLLRNRVTATNRNPWARSPAVATEGLGDFGEEMLLQLLRDLRKDGARSTEGGAVHKSYPRMEANNAAHVRAAEHAGIMPTAAANGNVAQHDAHAPASTISRKDEAESAALCQLLQMQLRQLSLSTEVDQESADASRTGE